MIFIRPKKSWPQAKRTVSSLLHRLKQNISQHRGLKECDSLSSRSSLPICTFLCSCLQHERDPEDQCFVPPPFEEACAVPVAAPPAFSLTFSVPHEGLPFTLLVYEPLPCKDRLTEDLAQVRPVWFLFTCH